MKNIEKKEISVKIKNVNVYFNKGAHMLLQKELIPRCLCSADCINHRYGIY